MQSFKDVGSMIVHQAETEIIVEDISRTQTHQYSYVRFIGTLNNLTLCPLICMLILIELRWEKHQSFSISFGDWILGKNVPFKMTSILISQAWCLHHRRIQFYTNLYVKPNFPKDFPMKLPFADACWKYLNHPVPNSFTLVSFGFKTI